MSIAVSVLRRAGRAKQLAAKWRLLFELFDCRLSKRRQSFYKIYADFSCIASIILV